MKKWIYNIKEFDHTGIMSYKFDYEMIENELNELGEQGWEVVSNVTILKNGFTDKIVYTLRKEGIMS